MDDGPQSQRETRPALLVLTSTYPRWRGDPEPGFVHELAKRLTDRFHVIVLGPQAPGAAAREMLDGVEVIRYRYAPRHLQTLVNDGGIITNLRRSRWKILLVPGFVLGMIWGALRLVRIRNIDVIHAHWLLPQGLIAALMRWLPGHRVPFVVTSHGADLFALRGKLFAISQRLVVAQANAVTVVSTPMLHELEVLGCDVTKAFVLSMGVDLQERFTPDPNVPRSSSELLFVGRLVEKKGVGHLIDAMPALLGKRPDLTLVVAGFGPDEDALKAKVEELDLHDSVLFLGPVEQAQLPSLYRRATLLVAPFVQAASGDEEGLGLVVVEAIGCHCPVVAGDVAAMTEIFGETQCEFVVDARNPRLLAERILQVISRPDPTHEQVARLRRLVRKRFDWQSVASQYDDLLRQCIETTHQYD